MIKTLFDIFRKDQRSLKNLKMSKQKRMLFNIFKVAVIVIVFSTILIPIVINADIIKETLFIDAGILSIIIGIYISFLIALITCIGFLYSSGYLDKNLDNYLFLPIKRRDFVLAKLAFAYYNMFIVTALCFLPFSLLYLYISKITIYGILAIILYLFSMPIFVLAITSLIMGTLMFFINKLKNKKLAKKLLYTVSVGLLTLVYLVLVIRMSNTSSEDYIALYLGLMSLIDKVSLFFTYPNLAYSLVINEDLFAILKMIVIMGLSVLAFLYFEKVYFKGARGYNEDSGLKRKKRNRNSMKVKSYSTIRWFLYREATEIFRTGIYFFNTVFVNVIIVVMYLGMMGYAYFFQGLGQDVAFLNEIIAMVNAPVIILITLAIGSFFTIFNMGAATIFSRDAKSLEAINSLPINKKQAIFGKVLFHEIVEFLTLAIFMIPPMIVLEIPVLYIFISVLVMILVVLATNFIPVIIDLNFPNLNWESETIVVKSSKSLIISMIVHSLLSVVIIGLGVFLIVILAIDYKVVAYLGILLYLVLFVVLSFVYSKSVDKAFRKARN